MRVLKLLGFGTNWNRVNKMKLAKSLYETGIIVKHMIHLETYDYDIENFFAQNPVGITKESAYKVILSFGRNCPTHNEYRKFQQFSATNDLLPSAKKLQENPSWQKSWTIAYHWANDYEQSKLETIIAAKQQKNVNLEQELQGMKAKINDYQAKLITVEAKKNQELLAKEQEIGQLKTINAKHKCKIKQLKRKYSYRTFKNNKIPELELKDFSMEQ